MGTFLKVDQQGNIIKEASIDKIQSQWLPIVEEVKNTYLNQYGTSLHSVYIRGSVVRGEAVENISDVDTLAIIKLAKKDIDVSWEKNFNEKLKKDYPFCTGVEICAIPFDERNVSDIPLMIKVHGVCIYGEDLNNEFKNIKIGIPAMVHTPLLGKDIQYLRQMLAKDNNDHFYEEKCRWIAKRILRTSFEILMEREKKYTRDLDLCYDVFSKYYPEQCEEMKKVLELALKPTSDKNKIAEMLDSIGLWLVNKVDVEYPDLIKI
ncbi:hypothetical protein [Candidatus Uabimicrobium sp. HlEnr_7]|uniref:hypothetical protein n=1 Tax=Candidatus Uabimicrobium helgolandensis TaxID=3095367 RepID=UPI003556B7E1